MNLTKKLIGLAAIALLAGCASQDSIIPQDGKEMKDIYRGALSVDDGKSNLHTSEAEAVCISVDIDESQEECLKKVQQVLNEKRLTFNTNPNGEVLDYTSYTRTELTEIDNLFPRHSNPDIVIYVYPHLATKARAPIPGYTTVIPLYERVQYRMPGESPLE